AAVEVTDEDLGVGYGAVGAVRVGHAMQREGSGVEVALGHDTGLVDEAVEIGAARDLRLVKVRGGAERLEIDVDDRVALRQQTRSLGRSFRAEVEREDKRAENGERDDERDPGASSHQR